MQAAWTVFFNSLLQFIALFGVFVVGGAGLTWLARLTNNVFQQFLFPNLGMHVFGVIGVPVHEFCHAFFCRLFLHEVKEVKWFDPAAKNGAHGSVEHLYNPWNLYHRIGHFFIGLGPVILGPVVMALLLYILVPASRGLIPHSVAGWAGAKLFALSFWHAMTHVSTLSSPWFYVFLYLAFCITSQMELSTEDLRQAAKGVLPLLLVLLCANAAALLFGATIHMQTLRFGQSVLMFSTCFFVFAGLLALFNLVFCAILMGVINKLCGHDGINPFRA